MKKPLIFIHGGTAYTNYEAFLNDLRTKTLRDLPGSEPKVRWTDTLATDLGNGFEVFKPRMPNSQNAKYLEWKIWFERYLALTPGEVILVGWSQGGYFLAKYLLEESYTTTISALYLLAAPFEPADFDGEDGGDFAFDTTRVGELGEKIGKITIMHSTDDPVVPFTHALSYAQGVPNATLVTFTDKNHFLVPELPELVALIKGL